jgi:hypothetical protein
LGRSCVYCWVECMCSEQCTKDYLPKYVREWMNVQITNLKPLNWLVHYL